MLPTAAPPPASHLRAGIARGERQLKRNPADERTRGELNALRAEYAATKLAEYIARVVNEAPPLTDEQRDRLAVLLRGDAA